MTRSQSQLLVDEGAGRVSAAGTATPERATRVLIVDDQSSIRSLLRDLLAYQRHETVLAADLNEAEAALRAESFDAVIVDIFLGDESKSGLHLLPLIRETQPHTPSIVISGAAEMEDVIAALKAGAYDLICKPFNLAEVQKAVSNAIEKKAMSEENARLVTELRRERDGLELRVEAATSDLASKVHTLHALNEQLSTIFEMSQARSIEASTEAVLEHIIGLLRKILTFEGAFCVALDLGAKDITLTYADNGPAHEINKRMTHMLLEHNEQLVEAMEASGRTVGDSDLVQMMAGLYPETWNREQTLIMPLYVPRTLLGVLGVIGISQPTHLTQAEERVLGFAISHFLAVIEERSFLNRTTQLASFGELVTEIAHDLRHPMTSMRGAARILSDQWGDQLKRERCIKQINTDLRRMESMTSELVNFFKPRDMNMVSVDLNELVSKAAEVSQYQIEQKRIKVVEQLEAKPSKILGISRNLVEAFVNLISNAVQSMEAEGTLALATGSEIPPDAERRLKEMGRNPERYLWMSVTDMGVGISEEEMDKIFLRFYTTREDGMGLGLSAVNRIVKKNLGTITVRSKLREGSTFTIYLPSA